SQSEHQPVSARNHDHCGDPADSESIYFRLDHVRLLQLGALFAAQPGLRLGESQRGRAGYSTLMTWSVILVGGLSLLLAAFLTGMPIFVAFLAINTAGILLVFGERGFGLIANSIF